MQCVIDISKNSQKMQWSMRIGTFLETRKINVEGTCCLQDCNLPDYLADLPATPITDRRGCRATKNIIVSRGYKKELLCVVHLKPLLL